MDHAKVRICLSRQEVEVEGSEAFVREYTDQIGALMAKLMQFAASSDATPAAELTLQAGHSTGVEAEKAASFGELFQYMPKTATDVDRILLAGFYIQKNDPSNNFTTAGVNSLLIEHGVKLSNPSECVRRNIATRRVFNTKGKYQVSQVGVEYLRHLMGAAFNG